ncbi:MAG TPA: sigma-70 family RNA polymerase sigma factor [Terriglobales bacterium]|nr:sigma-70 family RNA polymerase sigma factor [Terriglobales bacterium]
MRPEIQEAIELLRKRDPNSAERVLELIQRTVFSFSMKVCGHREDAEDTSQEVLVKATEHLPRLDDPGGLTTWLYTVAKNACLMRRRKSKSSPAEMMSLDELMPDREELEALEQSATDSPEHSVLREEEAERVRDAVLRIPPQYRLILVLHDMEELSTEDVARITGMTENTVRVRLHRARLFVRKELSTSSKLEDQESSARSSAKSSRPTERPQNCREMFAALSDYVDQRLADSLCAELEKHMSGCVPCQAFVQDLKRTIRELKTYNSESMDNHAAAAIRRVVLQKYEAALRRSKSAAN